MTMAAAGLRVYFEFGSPYTYLSIHRIEALSDQARVGLTWCPFLLGPIFAAQGWPTSPFADDSGKRRYMWRDVERRAALHRVLFKRPAIFPQNGLLAARVTLVGLKQGWGPRFVRSVFEAQFAEGRDISDPTALAPLIRHAGGAEDQVFAAASAPEIKAELRERTEEAKALGIFGAPTFLAGDEMFWGDDRLEEALAWCGGRHPALESPQR